MKSWITPFHTYENGWVSLPIYDITGLPEIIEVKSKKLKLKDEFHITMMAARDLAPSLNADDPVEAEKQLVADFVEFQKTNDLSRYTPSDVYRFVKRDDRETVIQMVEVPGINELYYFLRQKYNVDLPTQPAHITLYKKDGYRGIGLLSDEEIDRDSEIIEII